MGIPTELVGSLPRPMKLQEAYEAYDQGQISWPELQAEQDAAAEDSIRRLEETGRVNRTTDTADGRVANYEITAKGRRERRRLQTYMHDQLAGALAALPAKKRHELAGLMEALAHNLRAPREEQ